MSTDFGLIVLLIALVLGSATLGGGIYETVLVDRVWPGNPAIIQPTRGGLNRKVFWTLVHPPYELALLASVWLNWGFSAARPWLILALVAHFAARAWSFAYFIPRALRFEEMGALTDDQRRQADRWVELSRLRPLIEIVPIIALGIAIFLEAGNFAIR
jgi:hypothetical protein